MQQQQQIEQSRVGITFGEDFENGPIFIKLDGYVNAQRSEEQYEHLKNLVGDNLDIDWAIVVQQKFMPNKKDMLIESIIKLKDKPIFDELDVKLHSDDEFVYFSIKLKQDKEAEIQGVVQVLLDAGLQDIAKKQENSIKLDLEANYEFDEIVEQMKQGERIGGALLKQFKMEVNLSLSKDFSKEVENLIRKTDEEMLESPPMALINHFKTLDIDLSFYSADELPDIIKNQVMFGKKLQTDEQAQLPITKTRNVRGVIDCSADEGTIYFTIVGLAASQGTVKLPQLSTLLLSYGKALAKIFGLKNQIPLNI